jgi:hypothetical protein
MPLAEHNSGSTRNCVLPLLQNIPGRVMAVQTSGIRPFFVFVLVPPGVISLQLCTAKFVGV